MIRTYEVGDVIKKRKHLARLPEESVVVNAYGYPLIVGDGVTANSDGLDSLDPLFVEAGWPPYTVVWLR